MTVDTRVIDCAKLRRVNTLCKLTAVFTVRLADETDALEISDIHVCSRTSAYRGHLPDRYLDGEMPAESAAFWPVRMAGLEAGDGVAFIAEHCGKPVGFICIERPDAYDSIFVDNLHTLPDYKGHGVGGMLLEVARGWALARGARQMHLLVLAGNKPAIGFYESHGWSVSSSECITMGGVAMTALRFVLPL
ncbi:MAG: GNAT family N-acetyltransferase [Polaromonas sp.]